MNSATTGEASSQFGVTDVPLSVISSYLYGISLFDRVGQSSALVTVINSGVPSNCPWTYLNNDACSINLLANQ